MPSGCQKAWQHPDEEIRCRESNKGPTIIGASVSFTFRSSYINRSNSRLVYFQIVVLAKNYRCLVCKAVQAALWKYAPNQVKSTSSLQDMHSKKLVIPLHFMSWKKDSKWCCDTTMPESIHTKDESKLQFCVCFHLWGELPTTINVTEWQVSWN